MNQMGFYVIRIAFIALFLLANQGFALSNEYVLIKTEIKKDQIEIQFDWPQPTGLVVYKRCNDLWVGFDKPANFEMSQIKNISNDLIYSSRQLTLNNKSLLHFKIKEHLIPKISKKERAVDPHLRHIFLTPEPH